MGENVFVRARAAQGKGGKSRILQVRFRLCLRQPAFRIVKFRHARENAAPALSEPDPAPVFKNEYGHLRFLPFRLFPLCWQGVALCRADVPHGAEQAFRRGGQTYGRAQFHQALREISPSFFRICGRKFGKITLAQNVLRLCVAQNARQHAYHVPVYGGRGLFEGDGSDRARRIFPDAGQLFQIFRPFGKTAAGKDLPRRFPHVFRAAVIPEPLPKFHQFFFRAFRQRPYVGQFAQKAHVMIFCGLHARLLQHDLGYPHAVGIAVDAPGKAALVFVVPWQKARGQTAECFFSIHNFIITKKIFCLNRK